MWHEGDKERGIRILEKESREECVWSMSTIGSCFFVGDGVEKDLGRALALFEKAAKAGDVDAGPLLLSWPDISRHWR